MRRRGEPGLAALAWRGVTGLVVGVVVIVLVIAYGAGALSADPAVTSDIPGQSVGVLERSTVEYRGAVVGTVEEVRSDRQGTRLTLRMFPDQLENIPAGVRTRILPRTLFGDQYIDLVPPDRPGAGRLSTDEPIPADTSGETVELYTAFKRLFSVLQAVQPAKINTALTAVSEALSGRGAELGELIDQAHELTADAPALLATFGDTLGFVSDLSEQLGEVAPEGIQALENAIVLSQDLVRQKGNIQALLTGGLELMGQGRQLLGDNADRVIRLVDKGGEVTGALADNAKGITELYGSFGRLMTNIAGVVGDGRTLPVDLDVTLDGTRPYTSADCPRYGELTGPNCGPAPERPREEPRAVVVPPIFGGASGPVGSDVEAKSLTRFADRLAGRLRPDPGTRTGILGVLAGPILRGAEVPVP
ncbi:MCE family protein [Amycolatopsis umgeniensis]|uniref:Virulence factor Mce-like protein n=1 Tax=Amycolatopsis umgeniensis TaxID=336628 RepID=A0A841AZN3_9PSEU|nr:MCE family protein [Amycolatopsis umgeniensis]MBB5852091.1 virulence factor Mce-like protein [Amycolatopsis umgeniensis]